MNIDYIFIITLPHRADRLQYNGNYYVFNKPLAWQGGGYSDVNQRDMYYDHLKDIVYE